MKSSCIRMLLIIYLPRCMYRIVSVCHHLQLDCGTPPVPLPDMVRDSVRDMVSDMAPDSVRAMVRDMVGDMVRDMVRDSVGDMVPDSVRDMVGDTVPDTVRDMVRDMVGDTVRDTMGDMPGECQILLRPASVPSVKFCMKLPVAEADFAVLFFWLREPPARRCPISSCVLSVRQRFSNHTT